MRRIRLPRQLPSVKFPLHYDGAPQRRLFFPEWYFTMVKPTEKMPKNYVKFIIPADMTKYDVKEYLTKIYQVPVLGLRLDSIEYLKHRVGTPWKMNSYQWKFVEPFNIAHVFLADGMTFTFPDPLKSVDEEDEDETPSSSNLTPVDQMDMSLKEDQKTRLRNDRDKLFFENKWL